MHSSINLSTSLTLTTGQSSAFVHRFILQWQELVGRRSAFVSNRRRAIGPKSNVLRVMALLYAYVFLREVKELTTTQPEL